MAEYPRHLVHEHTLFDGRRVLIRPVRDDDERLEGRFMSDLCGENRYLRFQKWINAPSDKAAASGSSSPMIGTRAASA